MAVFKGENNTRNADQLQGENSMWLCLRGSGAETLESVATSQAVSVRVLLATRIFSLAVLVLGGLWISWRSGEPPLCLPDWSYLTSSAYFVLSVAASIRQAFVVRSLPGEESAAKRTWASSVTLLFLETSLVYQTIAVVVTWVEYAQYGERQGRALLSTVALGVVLVDLLLSRCRVEAKHAWILLAFLLAWAAEQVLWVSTGGDEREACYEVFDAKGLRSATSAVVAALVVVALILAYSALTAKRDRLMVRCGFGSDTDATAGEDVEEDLGEDAAVTRSLSLPTMTLRAPPASKRASVVNPIFAGSGSRMKRNPLSGASGGGTATGSERPSRRTSLASIETDMSSGELDAAENQTSGCSSARHLRESPAVAPPDGAGRRADLGSSAAGSGGVLPSHPSSWAGYGGGGAAAWVRSSRDATAPPRGGKGVAGGKGGHRRSNSRH